MKRLFILVSLLVFILTGCHSIRINDVEISSTEVGKFKGLEDKVFLGDEKAPNTLIIFNDFECSRCKEFHADIMPKVNADIKSGKVKVYYYHLASINETSYIKSLMGSYFERKYPLYYDQYIRAMFGMTEEESGQFHNEVFVKKKMSKLFPGLKTDAIVDNVFSEDEELTKSLKNAEQVAIENRVKQVPTVFVNNKQVINSFYYSDYEKIYKVK